MTYFRRRRRLRAWRALFLLLIGILFLDYLNILSTFWVSQTHESQARANSVPPEYMPSIYIACIFWNSHTFLNSGWFGAIVELAETIGKDRVFISIHESGSYDGTQETLTDLDGVFDRREIPHWINQDDESHASAIYNSRGGPGYVKAPSGEEIFRRIPFLAKQRNKSLEPLASLAANNVTFDKILFLNDISFVVNPCYKSLRIWRRRR